MKELGVLLISIGIAIAIYLSVCAFQYSLLPGNEFSPKSWAALVMLFVLMVGCYLKATFKGE